MNFFATIEKAAREGELPFLVIGGHAVNFYGFARETADLDFLVRAEDRPAWMRVFAELGFRPFSDSTNFAQLSSEETLAWPVDLMFVPTATFQAMLDAGQVMDFYGAQARIPTLEHLLALKLHALKNTRAHRFLKDFLDVENLIRLNRLDINSEKMRRLFEKYGTLEIYEKVSTALKNGG